MAAVTVDTGWPRTVVNGSMRTIMYRIDIAADADTLSVPLKVIKAATAVDNTLTAVGIASIAQSGRNSTVTFNSGGAITNCYCTFTGW